MVTLRFKNAVFIYVRFLLLAAIGPALAVACAFIGREIGIAISPHPKHAALYLADGLNDVFAFPLGISVGYIVAAIYEGALVVWSAAWVFRQAVRYVRNTDRYGLQEN